MSITKKGWWLSLFLILNHFLLFSQQRELADSLIHVLEQTKEEFKRIEIINDISQTLIPVDLEEALKYANQAKSALEAIENTKLKVENEVALGIIYKGFGAFNKALEHYQNGTVLIESLIAKHSDSTKYHKAKAGLYENIGVVYRKQGNFEAALKQYIMANLIYEKLMKNTGDDSAYLPLIGNSFNNIGVVHSSLGRREKAIGYFTKSINMQQQAGDSIGALFAIHNLGCEYKLNDEYDKALPYFEESLKLALGANLESVVLRSYAEIADIFIDKKQFAKALNYYNRSLQISEQRGDQEGKLQTYNGIGELYTKKGAFEKAGSYLLNSLKIAREIGSKVFISANYEDLSYLHEINGRNAEALKYYKLYKEQSDEIFDEDSDKAVSVMETAFETEKKERELLLQEKQIKLLEKDKALTVFMNVSLIACLVFITIIMAVVYRFQKVKSKKNRELLATRNKLMSYELENIKLKEKELEQQLAFKNKELTTHTLNLVQKNGIMEELKQSIREISKGIEGENAKKINQVKRLIDYSFNLDKDWNNFKLHFEQVHHNFFNELMETYSDLTSSECRLCALIKLNLSTKEIASILSINPESVKVARYRLRKKLGLDGQQNLTEFLINFNQNIAA